MGSARTFFEVVGSFQANRLIKDTNAAMTVSMAIVLDSVGGVVEAIEDMFDGVTDLIDEQMDAFFKYETELIRVKKFYQGAADEVEFYAESSKRLGETFAFTGAEALKAASQMAQMKTVLGESAAVIAGAEMGLLFAEIGGMETDMAMKRLTSLMQQTGFALGGLSNETYRNLDAETQANVVRSNTIRVLDQLNTIENSSVATMEEMTFVLNQFASQAALAGESMGDMASLAALLLEAGEESSRAGTGLRMMYSRLAVDGGEASKVLAEAIPELDAQTIATMNLTDVITALAPHYENMSDLERIRLTQAVAGNRHYVKLQKLIVNHNRLMELQAMAYTGQFTALDEFANRQESSLYQYDRAQAILENLRVEIGENLADAYVRALQPQERFLKGMKWMSESKKWSPVLGNILLMDAMIGTFKLPLDFIMGLLNTIISMKVLNVVLRSVTGASQIAQNSFAAAGQTQEFLSQQTLQTVKYSNMQAEAVVKAGVVEENRARAAMASSANVVASKKRHTNEILFQTNRVKLAMKDANETQMLALEKEHAALQIKAADKEKEVIQAEKNRLQANDVYNEAKIKSAQLKTDEAGLQALMSRSAKLKHEQIDASRTFSYHLNKEARLLRQEFIVTSALDVSRKKAIEARLGEITVTMVGQTHDLERLRTEKEGLILADMKTAERNKAIKAIDKKIAALARENKALADQRNHLELTIFAEKQHNDRMEITNATMMQKIFLEYKGLSAGKASLKMMQQSMWSFQALNSIMMLTADTEAEMYAGMLTMTAGFAIVKAAAWATGKEFDALIVKGLLVKGVMTGFIGGLVGYGIYTVSKTMIEKYVGDDSDLANIVEIENSMANIYGYATELSNLGKETVNPLMGDATWNDLRRDADLTAQMLENIGVKKDELNIILEEGEESLTKFEKGELDARIAQLETHYASVETIHNAHLVKMGKSSLEDGDALRKAAAADAAYTSIESRGSYARRGGGRVYKDIKRWYDAEGEIIAEAYEYKYDTHQEYIDEVNRIENLMLDEWTKNYNEFIRVNSSAYGEASKSVMLYSESVLTLRDEEENYQNTVIDGNTRMLESMEAFTDAREELFFGERSNFTGALYRQITQGGVENLLHKTEILQTNNFYGYTVDEMVEKVTVGVLNEIQNRT